MSLMKYNGKIIISKKGTVFVYDSQTRKRLPPAKEVATVVKMLNRFVEKEKMEELEEIVKRLGVKNLTNLFKTSFKGFLEGINLEYEIDKQLSRLPEFKSEFNIGFIETIEDMLKKVIHTYTDYKDEITFAPNLLEILWKLPKPENLTKIALLSYGSVMYNPKYKGDIEDELPWPGFLFDSEDSDDFVFYFEDLIMGIKEHAEYYVDYLALRYIVEKGLYNEEERDLMLNILSSEIDVTPKLVEKPKFAEFFSSLSDEDLEDDFFIENYGEYVTKSITLSFPLISKEKEREDTLRKETTLEKGNTIKEKDTKGRKIKIKK